MTPFPTKTLPQFTPFRARFAFLGLACLMAATGAAAQMGAKGDSGIDTSGNYQQEVAWCRANTTGTALVDCLKSSGAAQAEKRRGVLGTNGSNYDANAMARCEPFKGEELVACKARVAGVGGASGSVQGGGRLTWAETATLPADVSTVIILPRPPADIVIVPIPQK